MIDKSEKLEQIVTRKPTTEDIPFIIHSWLKSYRYGSFFTKNIRNKDYYKYHHQVVSRILERPGTEVILACDQKDEKVIYGYIVTESFGDKFLVHYLYVKQPFRRLGFAKILFNCAKLQLENCIITHWTYSTSDLNKKFTNLVYIPYLI